MGSPEDNGVKLEHALILVAFVLIVFALINMTTTTYPMHHMMSYGYNYNYLLLILALILLIYPFLKELGGKENKTYEAAKQGELEIDAGPESAQEVETEIKDEKELKTLEVVKRLLNEDEAKIVEIVLENEGITQDSLHFRTGFSHSKLSMILKKLEEKDVIVREKFGRTYKVYLSEWLKNQ